MSRLRDAFLRWVINRSPAIGVVTFDNNIRIFERYEPFWPDEYQGQNRPPWYRPFNILVHRWLHGEGEAFHDHPRWSITLCISGTIVERTPWKRRTLRPGSIVIRSRKNIHAFELPEQDDEVWTIFIVGRRNHSQNSYTVTPQG